MVVVLAESEAEYVHVTVAVDDGGWRAFFRFLPAYWYTATDGLTSPLFRAFG
jgi:hypothetical protein